ncbi:hypothetical protein FAVG1_10783 [Fusarium avenaceum]|nr:hypothetical protein FAVG1_10783 [Fusarium avenaceum]
MPAKSQSVPFIDTYSTSDAAGFTRRRIRFKHPPKTSMNNQQQDDANRVADRVQDQGIPYAGHPQNFLRMQSGLPVDAGNENQHAPSYPPGPDQRHDIVYHPGPVPNPNQVQIDPAQVFISTPFPPLEYRQFIAIKRISSAEWVSANTLIISQMSQRDHPDVDFQESIKHRIAPDLWPIIPLEIRPLAYKWLTQSQKDTLRTAPPPDFQTHMTTVEEHTTPPHPDEVYLRALESAIGNLPSAFTPSGARMKVELNHMFTCHLEFMANDERAGRWIQQQRDQTRHSTLVTWINSWSGQDNGLRPPINIADGQVGGRNTKN